MRKGTSNVSIASARVRSEVRFAGIEKQSGRSCSGHFVAEDVRSITTTSDERLGKICRVTDVLLT